MSNLGGGQKKNLNIGPSARPKTRWNECEHMNPNPVAIDVNGNGIANELLDLRALGERRISTDISSLSLPLALGSK